MFLFKSSSIQNISNEDLLPSSIPILFLSLQGLADQERTMHTILCKKTKTDIYLQCQYFPISPDHSCVQHYMPIRLSLSMNNHVKKL